ncbi:MULTISPECIES: hypothetical protein [unclassified Cryobacterium]|nr:MULTISPECIES: hypothetical protein [unclassified Cryobacterium]
MTRSRRARPVAVNGLDGLDGMSQFLTAAADALGNADTELGNAIRG